MIHRHPSRAWAYLLCLSIPAGSAFAQTGTDAGAIQQQIERERQQRLPQRVMPERPAPPAAMQPATGITVTVKRFRFAGNTLISSERLEAATNEFLGRPLDFSQLQAAAASAAEVYRAQGWVVRAYLPAQDIQDGIVTIQIIEAIFGGLRIEGDPQRISVDQLRRGVEAQQRIGDPLNADALDRALLLADDLPGITVSGALIAGKREGETDLVYKVADEPFVISEASLDNAGSRSTGATRLVGNLALRSPLGRGDETAISAILSEGTRYARAAHSIPVGDDGWRLGVNASYLTYSLNDIAAEGDSTTVGLEARYPLHRSRIQNLYFSIGTDHKNFDNRFNGAVARKYTIAGTTAGLYGNRFDTFGGGGASSAGIFITSGRRDNTTGTTDDRFQKLRVNASREQTISSEWSLHAAIDGQTSRDNLDTAESLYLGGYSGVRAYPNAEGRGSSGFLNNLELRWRASGGVTLSGFYDHGRVRNRDDSPSFNLQGAGLSLGWRHDSGINIRATLARRIGSNPNPTPAGKDQDGSLTLNRLWLSVSLPL